MHYQLGGPEHFKDAPERARVRLKHDDGREFFATDRTLGSDYWYIDGQKLSKSTAPMGGAIYHRTRVIARRSLTEPLANSMTDAALLAKRQRAEPPAKKPAADQTQEPAPAQKPRYTVSKGMCARHGMEYFKTYGCKKCRAEQRANGVEQTATPIAPDHVWGEPKQSPSKMTCEKHPHISFSADRGECWKCVQENTPPVTEEEPLILKCPTHQLQYPVDGFCSRCKDDADKKAAPPVAMPEEPPASLRQVGGGHYDRMDIDVFEFCEVNKLGFVESTAIKYIARRKGETRVEDLRKAINCLERLIKHEETGSWAR